MIDQRGDRTQGCYSKAVQNSQFTGIIGAGVCIGMGSSIHAYGTIEVEVGAILWGFADWQGKIGANACIGFATTILRIVRLNSAPGNAAGFRD